MKKRGEISRFYKGSHQKYTNIQNIQVSFKNINTPHKNLNKSAELLLASPSASVPASNLHSKAEHNKYILTAKL